jgi:hypothetical protein
MNSRSWKPTSLLLLLGLAAGSARSAVAAANDTVVVQWNDATLQAIRDTHPGPPMCARDLAIVSTCMYDAWAAYDPYAVGTRLGATLRRPAAEQTTANKNQAISFAAYRALVDLFPQADQAPKFVARLHGLGYDPADASTDPRAPSGVGNLAAQAVLAFRHQDGANQLGDLNPGAYSDYTGYAPVNTPDAILDPDHWQPLRVADGKGGFVVQKCVAPHWGHVLPFALTAPDQRPPDRRGEGDRRILGRWSRFRAAPRPLGSLRRVCLPPGSSQRR